MSFRRSIRRKGNGLTSAITPNPNFSERSDDSVTSPDVMSDAASEPALNRLSHSAERCAVWKYQNNVITAEGCTRTACL